jgi:hypothetical protein
MYVGKGANRWPNVHVVDLAELYLRVFEAAIKGTAPEGAAGLYYPAAGHFTWSEVSHRVAQVLHSWRLLDSPIATTGLQPGWFWGSNVRVKCTNGTGLGWTPNHGGTKAMLDGVEWDATLVTRMLGAGK